MPAFDLPLAELERYLPTRSEPGDFDAFWARTLDESRAHHRPPQFVPYPSGFRNTDVFDVTFSGFAGQPVKAWFLSPKVEARLPCVIEYVGYGGGRGYPTDHLRWSVLGYAHLVMDARGQGGGSTRDLSGDGSGPQYPGFLTSGIHSPGSHYYRRLMTDAVLALDAVCERPEVDPGRLAVAGTSQGGGLALAVAGLDRRPKALLCNLPFLCHFVRAAQITEALPYAEVSRYCAAQRDRAEDVFRVLSYFDGLNFAVRASAQALFSVALFDEICPPSTVFAAYNYYAGPKAIRVYPYNHHEGGQGHQDQEETRFLAEVMRWPDRE